MIPQDLHPDLAELLNRCAAEFEKTTGHPPSALAAAPGRVNLIGEHTDYNDGFVLPMAIDRWCVAAGSIGRAVTGRVQSIEAAATQPYDPQSRDPKTLSPWARYAVGAIWKTADSLPTGSPQRSTPFDVVLTSSVPLGSGLSSSASLECAVAALTSRLLGLQLTPPEIAVVARAAEHDIAGVPCGVMDQDISACGEPGKAILIDCRTRQRTPIALPDPAEAIVVVAHSGIRHALGAGEYALRRASCQRAAEAIGVGFLRDANLSGLQAVAHKLAPADLACARHIITENNRVLEFLGAIKAGELRQAGALMFASHASLRDDFCVSCAELDAMVAAAMLVPGVFGSRMTGAGFGGCTVTLCQPESLEPLRAALAKLKLGPDQIPPFTTSAVGGVKAWSSSCVR